MSQKNGDNILAITTTFCTDSNKGKVGDTLAQTLAKMGQVMDNPNRLQSSVIQMEEAISKVRTLAVGQVPANKI